MTFAMVLVLGYLDYCPPEVATSDRTDSVDSAV